MNEIVPEELNGIDKITKFNDEKKQTEKKKKKKTLKELFELGKQKTAKYIKVKNKY